ncbi:MAG: carboxypeptidase-like regulatory domain-containing protein, partial [Candidatus Marinimicrobia bacterium]|nr:carboxypeptidase-like regulatory domain-containing protein [Candidatus Neomarinimicrobiota bacterium]
MTRKAKPYFLIFILLIIFTISTFAQVSKNAIIRGKIIDSKKGEPIPYANVVIVGTSMGSSTDLEGRYVIRNIPSGHYVLKATYIGYEAEKDSIQLDEGEELRFDLQMKPVTIKGEEVVVKGQASGQSQAVNREINSSQIVNYVSSAKIKELPDANAAESVGRLPGVSVLRSGGEGNKIVIRGLAPKYNKITIDGVEMESSNSYNRSTDLSMISSNMLEGIEVKKTVTPDIDANVMGGVVDFEVREARVEEPGESEYSFLAQGGYNNLPNAYKNKFNNYKFSGSIENRLLNNKLGIFAQVSAERKNLMSDKLGVWYTHFGNSRTKYIINSVSLTNTPRNKQRYNGALSLDYQWGNGNKIKFTNFVSSEITKSKRHTESYIIGSNLINYWLYDSQERLNSITNSLSLEKKIPVFDLDWSFSHSYSKTRNPHNWDAGFTQTSAGLSEFDQKENIRPVQVPKGADRDLSDTHLRSFQNSNSSIKSRSLNTALDLKTDINITENIRTEIKFGGEYRHKIRSYEYEEYDTPQLLNSGSALFVDNLINEHFGFPMNRTKISINRFLDDDLDYHEFLDGDYELYAPMDYDMLSEVSNLLQDNIDTIAASGNEG